MQNQINIYQIMFTNILFLVGSFNLTALD